MKIDRVDHLALTVRDVQRTCSFYAQVLGMEVITFGEGRKALRFGAQKINLHAYGREYEPKAGVPMPGSAELCFVTSMPLDEVARHLERCAVALTDPPGGFPEAGSSPGSLSLRDPDGNLITVSTRCP